MARKQRGDRWKIADSVELYGVESWGRDYFSVNDHGHLVVGSEGGGVDLKELVDGVTERGIGLPLLIRFSDLLKARIAEIHGAFHQAIEEYEYRGE
jgi:arginine decarboxylase